MEHTENQSIILRMNQYLIALVLLLLLAVALRLLIPHLGSSVAGGVIDDSGEKHLAACPSTPNCHMETWPVATDARQALNLIMKTVTAQKGTGIVSRSDDYLHVTFSTPLMGFVDDVEFLHVASPHGLQAGDIQVRSASRIGHSDLGANRKRVARLRQQVSALISR